MNDESIIRLEYTLLAIAEKVALITDLQYKLSTILARASEFR